MTQSTVFQSLNLFLIFFPLSWQDREASEMLTISDSYGDLIGESKWDGNAHHINTSICILPLISLYLKEGLHNLLSCDPLSC